MAAPSCDALTSRGTHGGKWMPQRRPHEQTSLACPDASQRMDGLRGGVRISVRDHFAQRADRTGIAEGAKDVCRPDDRLTLRGTEGPE
jgi:hypothetical protein